MSKPIFLRVDRTEGYEDMCDDLLLDEFLRSPLEFNVSMVDGSDCYEITEFIARSLLAEKGGNQ